MKVFDLRSGKRLQEVPVGVVELELRVRFAGRVLPIVAEVAERASSPQTQSVKGDLDRRSTAGSQRSRFLTIWRSSRAVSPISLTSKLRS